MALFACFANGADRASPRTPYYAVLSDAGAAVGQQRVAALARDHGLRVVPGSQWTIQALGRRAVTLERPAQLAASAPGARNDAEILRALNRDPRVEFAGVVSEYRLAGKLLHTDPYLPLQHALVTTRVDESHQIATGKGVDVGIIDTGIDRMHEDLRNRIVHSLNFADSHPTAQVIEFHGTAVAGIIGAEAGNLSGISGVAPEARLYALRACSESNPSSGQGVCTTVALARAIDWAIVNHLKVLNMSLRGQSDPLVTRLIRRAVEQGAIVVAATELRDGSLAYPASLEEVIAVSDQESNSLVGLAAHSERIFIAPGEDILTTMPYDTYDFVTGASFAAAHVTGIVALLVERAPSIDAFDARRLLRDSVRVINWGIILDSCAALALVSERPNCRAERTD